MNDGGFGVVEELSVRCLCDDEFFGGGLGERECEGVGFMCVKGVGKKCQCCLFCLCFPIAQPGVAPPGSAGLCSCLLVSCEI